MHDVLLDKHRGWKVLLALLLASAWGCQSDDPARDDQRTVGPPLLDTPWTPPNTHHDEPFIQEVGTVVGNLTDVRSIAVSPDGTCFVATPDGILQSSGAGWKSLAIDASVSSLAISFDATGVMATGGPQGATLDGTTMPLPSSTQVAFIAPRTQGGWWLAGPSIAGYYDRDGGGSGDATFHPLDALAGLDVRAITSLQDGTWFAATSDGVVTPSGVAREGQGLPSSDVRDVVIAGDQVWVGTSAGMARLDGAVWLPFLGADGLHYGDILDLATDTQGVLLVSTTMGASRYHPDGSRRYYFGRNWLADNEVRGTARSPDGALWFATAGGVSRVDPIPTTLAEKADRIDRIAHERHVRLGYTSTENHLEVAGDVATYWNGDDDNDGQWTGMYLASQSLRCAVTGDPQARDNARVAAEALLRLQRVDGMDGFFARSVVPPEECDARQASGAGEWHRSQDGAWCWKGDTSSDELVGHIFGLSLYHDLVASEQERGEVASALATLLSSMIDNGFQLLDVDGQVTEHGHFEPDWMHNNLAAKFGDAGLNSAMILGALHAVYRMTGQMRFRNAFDYLAREEGYADYVRRIEEIGTSFQINHDSEEMSFLALYTLMRYEDDPALMAQWKEGLSYLWEVQRPERDPEFNLMYAALSRADVYDLDTSVRTLQRTPQELILWGLDQQHRWDRDQDAHDDRHGDPQNTFVFPYDERQVMRWSENPYAYVQPGNGTQESSGIFWLLPYWIGRYHGLID